MVSSGTEKFFTLWSSGWHAFVAEMTRLGKLNQVRINKVYWAERTESGAVFLPAYSSRGIQSANSFLDRLYSLIAEDLEQSQFFEFSQDQFVGSDSHRWGLSPFYYITDYYKEALEMVLVAGAVDSVATQRPRTDVQASEKQLSSMLTPEYLLDRAIESWHEYVVDRSGSALVTEIEAGAISGNCDIEHRGANLSALFAGGMGSYQCNYRFPVPRAGYGVGARIRLSSWKAIRYLGIGYPHEGKYRHVKIVNPRIDDWFDFSIGHGDLAFGLQNDWESPPLAIIEGIRFYISGEPEPDGAVMDIARMWCWDETSDVLEPARIRLPIWPSKPSEWAPVSSELLEIIYHYLSKCFRIADDQARAFMENGVCPLYGESSLKWPMWSATPSDLHTVGTYRFSWHALHPATILMMYARASKTDSPLFAARDFVTTWLDSSYLRNDPDKKFAWYDHGTAERQLAMLLMWAIGVERRFDHRFMSRIRSAIFRHGQLLDSELFYASHQPTRYHNHAWFQDLTLIATALVMPDFPCAGRWLKHAMARLTDQLDTLIVRDNGYAVFVENSIGYHQGVQRLVGFAGDLMTVAGLDSNIPSIAAELGRFSDFFKYPDGRSPAQGDTFRRANRQSDGIRRVKAYAVPECVLLPKAGYAVIKGNHYGIPFMFCCFATSLCRTHKHEDNLSFTLFFDGIEWLIDPSFYSHEYKAPIPSYLRSAVAHNALVIPELAYSIDPGMASLVGVCKGEQFEFKGKHSAYSDIDICRNVTGYLNQLHLEFVDHVKCARDHLGRGDDQAHHMLHCGENVNAILAGSALILSHPDSRFHLRIGLPSSTVAIHSGTYEEDMVRGVSGLGFMQQSSISTIECRVPFNADIIWTIEAIRLDEVQGEL
jgi:hypothetical protein